MFVVLATLYMCILRWIKGIFTVLSKSRCYCQRLKGSLGLRTHSIGHHLTQMTYHVKWQMDKEQCFTVRKEVVTGANSRPLWYNNLPIWWLIALHGGFETTTKDGVWQFDTFQGAELRGESWTAGGGVGRWWWWRSIPIIAPKVI